MENGLKKLEAEFEKLYQKNPRFFRAPGRVNLIGEHTDYNGGFVLPMAIERETVTAAAARNDRKVRVRSLNLEADAEFDLDEEKNPTELRGKWIGYVEGVARVLEREGIKLNGADLLISSTVPTGAGLSSSAALEMSSGLALTELSGHTVDRVTLALAGQRAEHEYVGANVGIMDQFISAMGKKEHALLIDCRKLESKLVPLDLNEYAIAVCDSKVKHDHAGGEYNARRSECEEGVKLLKNFLPDITQLRDVELEDFEKFAGELPEIIRKRCRHVITENERTLKAAECLQNSDFEMFGKLMFESHRSLRDDYEVSSKELDLLVDIASKTEGVIGARMTGGGFGGSTVNLVKREKLKEFEARISAGYERKTGVVPDILVTNAAEGAGEVK